MSYALQLPTDADFYAIGLDQFTLARIRREFWRKYKDLQKDSVAFGLSRNSTDRRLLLMDTVVYQAVHPEVYERFLNYTGSPPYTTDVTPRMSDIYSRVIGIDEGFLLAGDPPKRRTGDK